MIYRFDGFELDEGQFELRNSEGRVVPLQARALELLLLLVRHATLLVSKDTIIQEVWGGLNVSRKAIPFQVTALRAALRDTSKPYRWIETVHGKGLRFLGEVVCEKGAMQEPAAAWALRLEPDVADLRTDLIGEQPTIAVLPFEQVFQDDNLGGLARALPADILLALSRLRVMRVTARSSSFMLGRDKADPGGIKTALGVDYSVQGAISRAGDKREIHVELADNNSQAIVWADRFEIDPRDVHDARQSIAGRIVNKIESEVPRNEVQRMRFRQPESLTAWQAYHVAQTLMGHRTIEANTQAIRYFERSVAIDPAFARGWAGLAHAHAFKMTNLTRAETAQVQRALVHSAERAVESDPDDAAANLWLGRAYRLAETGHECMPWLKRALEISPSATQAHQCLSWVYGDEGELGLATDHAVAALKLDPQGPDRFSLYRDVALAFMNMGEMDKVIHWGCKAGEAPTDEVQMLLLSTISNHFAGNLDQAQRLALRFKKAFPDVRYDDVYGADILNPEMLAHVKNIYAGYGIT